MAAESGGSYNWKEPRRKKSYKYRHKLIMKKQFGKRNAMRLCDSFSRDQLSSRLASACQRSQVNCVKVKELSSSSSSSSRTKKTLRKINLIRLLIQFALSANLLASFASSPTRVNAFCPFKCACNDLELTANCTQVGAISIVPMTLNPLLKRLTLNHLPISELSNSLALYRQLEYLNLNSNQLRLVKYANFNFKSAPKVINLNHPTGSGGQSLTSNGQQLATSNSQSLSEQNEAFARHLKHSIERQVGSSSSSSPSSGDDEIRFHLRELHLADNKLEQLADYQPSLFAPADSAESWSASDFPSSASNRKTTTTLRAHELERLAPFLTLSKLELLDLSGNRLARLHQHVFLGLLRLKRLDLSRNQLEFIDRHALVGLISLEHLDLSNNRLVRHQQQLFHLRQVICFGPLSELRHLDLSSNDGLGTSQQQHASSLLFAPPLSSQDQDKLILPNQMFICAPNLTGLRLRSLKLKYVQAQAFDQLQHLQTLDLSENLFEQVPLQVKRIANTEELNDQLVSLRELKLSKTLIEFVSANSFENLKQLKRLEMSQMPHLVSFDLASLVTSSGNLSPTNEMQVGVENLELEELELKQNHKLQALRSSSSNPIKFHKLKLLDLSGSSELREVHLDKMIDLNYPNGHLAPSNSNLNFQLQVDISNSNSLNCSSCQLAWLIDAFKQRRPLATPTLSPPFELAGGGSRSSGGGGWSPIPFDPYNSFAAPTSDLVSSGRNNWPTSRVLLLNSDLINCAWPFNMPLIELNNLETNYAPLFGRGCKPEVAAAAAASRRFELQQSHQMQQLQAHQHHQLLSAASSSNSTAISRQLSGSSNNVGGGELASSVPASEASNALIGLLLLMSLVSLLVLGVRFRALLAQRRKLHLNNSPSFTATTSIDSPSSNCGSSAGSQQRQLQQQLIANPLANGSELQLQSQSQSQRAQSFVLSQTQAQTKTQTQTKTQAQAHDGQQMGLATNCASASSTSAASYYYCPPATLIGSHTHYNQLKLASGTGSGPAANQLSLRGPKAAGQMFRNSSGVGLMSGAVVAAETHHNSPIGSARLSSLLNNSLLAGQQQRHWPSQAAAAAAAELAQGNGIRAAELEGSAKRTRRTNLFSRFAARLSGSADWKKPTLPTTGHLQAAEFRPVDFVASVGTSLRFNGGRVPYGHPNPLYQSQLSTGRVYGGQPEAATAAAAAAAAMIYGNHQSLETQEERARRQFEANVQVPPPPPVKMASVANHYSICGADENDEEQEQEQEQEQNQGNQMVEIETSAYDGDQVKMAERRAHYATLDDGGGGQMQASGVVGAQMSSGRKNKRRRRRLDDNHANGPHHLNQLHARANDYNQPCELANELLPQRPQFYFQHNDNQLDETEQQQRAS